MKYSISQVSQITGLNKYTLRYYEKEKLIPEITRNTSGHRSYSEDDLEWIKFLINIKQTGMSIDKIKQFAQMKFDISTMPLRRKMLLEHRQDILEQEEQLHQSIRMIDKKLMKYDCVNQGVE